MWRWLVAATLVAAGPALGADNPDANDDRIGFEAPLTVGPFGGKDPIEAAEEELKGEDKSEAELEAEERLKAIEDAQSEQAARVVVLKWQGTDTDHKNDQVQRNIKTRIARPTAKFYPEIDLYQAGRKEPDRTIRPLDQRAVVPDHAISKVDNSVSSVETIPWNGLSEQDWGLKAHELRELANEIWFVDRAELREPLFKLYSQIGRAAENQNNPAPPFYEQVGNQTVNYYWYLAGSMAHEDPSLLAKITDPDMNASIGYYKDQLDAGSFPPMTLSFDFEGQFDMKTFAKEYKVFINGLEVLIDDPKGLHPSVPGRVDVYLGRSDGHSLSDRIELDKLNDKIYGVIETARKRMGIDFIDQLMEHPNECTPELDGDILNYLAIYAKLHPEAEIYITVPVAGSVNKLLLWRWDRPSGTLQKVLDDTGGFPVRFVALLGTGIVFSGASPDNLSPAEVAAKKEEQIGPDGAPPADASALSADSLKPSVTPEPSAIPIIYGLRGHYGRLMIGFGMQYNGNITGSKFEDSFQTRNSPDQDDGRFRGDSSRNLHFVKGSTQQCTDGEISAQTASGDDAIGFENLGIQPCPDERLVGTSISTAEDGDTEALGKKVVFEEQLRRRSFQRLVHWDIGVVLGKDAAVGFGPRGFIRFGWYNAPHAIDLTGHIGYAAQGPGSKATGRVRPILDADMYAGVILPFQKTIYSGQVMATFGLGATAGLTF